MWKKMCLLLLSLSMPFSMAACGSSSSETESVVSEEITSTAQDAGQKSEGEAWEITYSNARSYTDGIGTTWVQVIVEIENTGTSDLYLSSGSYDLEDGSGNLIKSSTMVSTFPDVISPGEKAYMYEETTLDNAVEGSLVVLPRLSVEKATVENIRFTVTDVEISTDQYGQLKAMGRVENTSGEESSMTYIVVILKDSGGTPIGQMFTILTDTLAAGDKIGFETTEMALPDDVTAEQVASFEVYAYPMQMQF